MTATHRRLTAGVTLSLMVALIIVLGALPAFAWGDHKKDTTTTSTTTPIVRDVEVCRDGQIIIIPVDQLEDTDERIWHDFDRRDCQPPRIPTPTTIPEVNIAFPPYTVGYICPGTDGIVYELPWGTAEDMWPTPESAKLYGCPVAVDDPTTTTVAAVVLPFTGADPGLLVLAGTVLIVFGLITVRTATDR